MDVKRIWFGPCPRVQFRTLDGNLTHESFPTPRQSVLAYTVEDVSEEDIHFAIRAFPALMAMPGRKPTAAKTDTYMEVLSAIVSFVSAMEDGVQMGDLDELLGLVRAMRATLKPS